MDKIGKDQRLARVMNKNIVIDLIRKNASSATVLAKEIGLSNAALSSILNELIEDGLIQVSSSESVSGKGRRQIVYAMNPMHSLIIALSLQDKRSKIVISNIREEILYEETQENIVYDLEHIYEMILGIKNVLDKPQFKDIPVKCIVASLPGRVNLQTGELQLSKQFDTTLFQEKNMIVNIFNKYFNCEVHLYNDTYLAMIGEASRGKLIGYPNALLVHIDEGVGACYIFNDQIYKGDQGYAGEFGLLRVNFHGQEVYLDDVVSLRAIKERTNSARVRDLIKTYEENEEIKDIVLDSARLLGKTLKDTQEILNFSKILLTGRIIQFGQEYLNIVQSETKNAYSEAIVEFSNLGIDATITGGISLGAKRIIEFENDRRFSNGNN